jgi:hypothetical protein
MNLSRIVPIAALGLLTLGACSSDLEGTAKLDGKPSSDGVSNGVGTKDATADVGAPTAAAPDAIGFVTIKIPVTNHSSGRSDYWIDLVIESADGKRQFETTSATVNGLEAGQSTTVEAFPFNAENIPANAVVRITKVQRTASV